MINLYDKSLHWDVTLKLALENFYITFINKDFSVYIASISLKLLGVFFIISSGEACLKNVY